MRLANIVRVAGAVCMGCGSSATLSPSSSGGGANPNVEVTDAGSTESAENSFAGTSYCEREGCECKVEGWEVPDLSDVVAHSTVERQFQGFDQILHGYDLRDGTSVASYEVKGGRLHAWEVGIGLEHGDNGHYAISDNDCDGIFEAKDTSQFSLGCGNTPPCATQPPIDDARGKDGVLIRDVRIDVRTRR